MRSEFWAMCFQYGGQIVTALLNNRSPQKAPPPAMPLIEEPPIVEEGISQEIPQTGLLVDKEGASSIAAGCVPCAIGHISTCSGVLSEAMRFARSDGLGSNEVIDRISHCLEELNTMEREDLSPLKIASLPAWEKDLANQALNVSRQTRHKLEGIAVADDLEKTAAEAQVARQEIARGWFKHRLANMSAQEKAELAQKTLAKLEEE